MHSPQQSLRPVNGVTVGTVWPPERTTRDALIEALTEFSGRGRALRARTRELASEVKQLRADRRQLRSRMTAASEAQPVASRPARARVYFASDGERRRLDRDLHEGVQNEIVTLNVKLQHAQEDRHTPPKLAGTLSALAARAEAALDAAREIAPGTYPSALTAFNVDRALRAQARPASIHVSLGTAPRSTHDAEVAAYFPCPEAIKNLARHASRTPQATLRLNYDREIPAVCIQDDGLGLVTRTPKHAPA